MSMSERLEKEFAKDNHDSEKSNTDNNLHNVFAGVLGDQDYEKPIPDILKQEIKNMVSMLDDFYKKKIDPADATMLDAFEYIPLFCLNGAILASAMGIPYEDYLRIVDIMIVLSGVSTEDV